MIVLNSLKLYDKNSKFVQKKPSMRNEKVHLQTNEIELVFPSPAFLSLLASPNFKNFAAIAISYLEFLHCWTE